MKKTVNIHGGEKELLVAASLISDCFKDANFDPLILPTLLYTKRQEEREDLRIKMGYAEVCCKAPSLVAEYYDRAPADFFEAPPEVVGTTKCKNVWRADKDGALSIQALCERYFENEILYRLFKIKCGEPVDIAKLDENWGWNLFKARVRVEAKLF